MSTQKVGGHNTRRLASPCTSKNPSMDVRPWPLVTSEGHSAITGHILSKRCFRCSMHNKGGHIFQINLFVGSDFLIFLPNLKQFVEKLTEIRAVTWAGCVKIRDYQPDYLLRLGNYAKYTQKLLLRTTSRWLMQSLFHTYLLARGRLLPLAKSPIENV